MVLRIYGAGAAVIVMLILGICVAYGVVGLSATGPAERVISVPLTAPLAPNDDLSIVFLGASLTSRGRWAEDLKLHLAACRPGRVATDMVALSGASSRWGARVLADYLASHESDPPDILVVEFSAIDASIARGFPLWFSGRNHREIIRLARQYGVTVMLATMNPAWGRQAWERPGQYRYQALYRDLAAKEGTGLVDTIADWEALPETDRLRTVPDGLHPTNAAMAAITLPAVEAALRPMVCAN